MSPHPADERDDNPWSAARYQEAEEEDRAAGTRGFRLSGQAAMLILGVLLGIGITIYGAYLSFGG